MISPKQHLNLKFLDQDTTKKKLEKGIACGYRTQQMSKISLA